MSDMILEGFSIRWTEKQKNLIRYLFEVGVDCPSHIGSHFKKVVEQGGKKSEYYYSEGGISGTMTKTLKGWAEDANLLKKGVVHEDLGSTGPRYYWINYSDPRVFFHLFINFEESLKGLVSYLLFRGTVEVIGVKQIAEPLLLSETPKTDMIEKFPKEKCFEMTTPLPEMIPDPLSHFKRAPKLEIKKVEDIKEELKKALSWGLKEAFKSVKFYLSSRIIKALQSMKKEKKVSEEPQQLLNQVSFENLHKQVKREHGKPSVVAVEQFRVDPLKYVIRQLDSAKKEQLYKFLNKELEEKC